MLGWESGFDLGGADALLEVFDETIVVGWQEGISHDGGAVGILLSLCRIGSGTEVFKVRENLPAEETDRF